jgi:predicted nuclease of predicted toxin-antitoxin system
MKLLLDENCTSLGPYLRDLEYDVYTVPDVLDRPAGVKSISDDRILAFAKSKKYLIVTKDQGLINECERQDVPCIGLGTPQEEAELVDKKLGEILLWKRYL